MKSAHMNLVLCAFFRLARVECSLLVTSKAKKVEPAAGTLLIKLGAIPRNKACLQQSNVSVSSRVLHSALTLHLA